ncbi:MAG: hypothetical protein IJ934_01055 [Acetobacter sp.]|nr:hypothetical protein [Acetobacter sp.]
MKLLTRLSLLTLVVCPLVACQGLSKQQRKLLNSLIGKHIDDVIQAFGVPNRKFVSGNHTYLAYVNQQTDYTMPMSGWGWGGPGWGPGWGWGWGGWGGWGTPGMAYTYTCQTTFELVNGIVTKWTRRGNGC